MLTTGTIMVIRTASGRPEVYPHSDVVAIESNGKHPAPAREVGAVVL